jgi:SAM-dependent methyltransferase
MNDGRPPDATTWSPPALLARLYDWEHDDFQADAELYVQLARRTGGPVLELACGSGRILAPLAAAGCDVVGVDRSAAMLERAGSRLGHLGERACLIQGDMVKQVPERAFPLVVLALDAFGFIAEIDQQLRLLRAVRRCLGEHGLLALDVVHAPPLFDEVQGIPVLQRTGVEPATGANVVEWMVRTLHPAIQQLELLSLYDLTWPNGEARRLTESIQLRYYSRYELEHLFGRVGLAIEAIYGDYDLGELEDASPRLIVLARPGTEYP